MDRQRLADQADQLAADLNLRGVRAVAMTFVDNAGIARVKSVPIDRLSQAAAWGVGATPMFEVFCVDDSITSSPFVTGPTGDLRLYPDLDQLTVLSAQPGWAWAPVDKWTQDDQPFPGCQRTYAKNMARRAADAGFEFRMAFEIEWYLGLDEHHPAATGPAYGMTRVVELSAYADALLAALAEQDVPVEQFHPEYATGQLEISVGATDPVAAADRQVLVRQTIRAVARAHGFQVSFAPIVVSGAVGNGAHLHFSPWSQGRNMFAGGDGPYGLTAAGESVLAGLLERLRAFTVIGCPSPASYLRLMPQKWAGPYQAWGRENREVALRLITGTVGERDVAANAELKCVDGASNPYLVVGAVCAIAADSGLAGLKLPEEVVADPSSLPGESQPPRLPQGLPEAIDALAGDQLLTQSFGRQLLEAFVAVRRAEHALFVYSGPETIAEATRWRY